MIAMILILGLRKAPPHPSSLPMSQTRLSGLYPELGVIIPPSPHLLGVLKISEIGP